MRDEKRNPKALGLSLLLLVAVSLGLVVVVAAEDVQEMQYALVGPDAALAPARLPVALEEAGPSSDAPGEIHATEEITSPSWDYVTVPGNFPHLLVETSTADVDAGYVFIGAKTRPGYLLIVDNTGDPIYQRRNPPGTNFLDFKPIGDGLLGYADPNTDQVVIMDSSYTVTRTIVPGDGLIELDPHEFLLLDNGNFLIEANETRIIDMSVLVPGGNPAALVTGQVLQEIDPDDNVVWTWSSWDHYTITDAAGDLTAPNFEFAHINSIEIDHDGGILLSPRRQDEVTKIDKTTGDVVWRLGGPNNDFTLVGGGDWHIAQHDARRLDSGNVSVYDNRCSPQRGTPCTENSRALEYELDEVAMEATIVWEHWNRGQGIATGNAQRLGNGNTMIGWGNSNFLATEVLSNGVVAFNAHYVGNTTETEVSPGAKTSYRVVRHPWKGCPAQPPTLVAQYEQGDDSITLHYSWNGATSVTEYEVFAGTSPAPATLLTTQPRTRFEDMTVIVDPEPGMNYFRVLPVTSDDCVGLYSNEVSVRYGWPVYLPVASKD